MSEFTLLSFLLFCVFLPLLQGSEYSIDRAVNKHKTPCFVFTLTLLSAIGGFLFGYDTGVVSGATLPISEKFHLNTVWKELFVSITGILLGFLVIWLYVSRRWHCCHVKNCLTEYTLILMDTLGTRADESLHELAHSKWLTHNGRTDSSLIHGYSNSVNKISSSLEPNLLFLVGAAAIFAIIGGILNDRIGRKPTTLLASFVFCLGAILLAAAQNKAMLLAGRFILGVGIGKFPVGFACEEHSLCVAINFDLVCLFSLCLFRYPTSLADPTCCCWFVTFAT